jgi:nicotinate-nucleotide pyrophosphorylase (carboxylating)
MLNRELLVDEEIEATVRNALAEDVGTGDLTAALVPQQAAVARVVCREDAIICGRPWFDRVFQLLDPSIDIDWLHAEGERAGPGQTICQLHGPARPILTAERTALNFLQTLSGVATTTHQYVTAVAGTTCRILDTRKTLPGLRKAQKYAVTCGGGTNHRIGLYDAILIKENHIHAAGSVCAALRQALALAPDGMMVEIEVEDLAQLQEAIDCGASRVLLDNFPTQQLPVAVAMAGDKVQTELSGNVTLETIAELARSGVDYISVGALTKHVRAVDFSMVFIS